MEIPVYVIYELLIRLNELNTDVGDYISNKKINQGILVRTSTGIIALSDEILSRQFHDPSTISQQEILDLLKGFELDLS